LGKYELAKSENLAYQ